MTRKPATDEGRCTGHCCEMFTLPFSPEELMLSYRAWQRGRNVEPLRMSGSAQQNGADLFEAYARVLVDIHLIAPMVIHLGLFSEPQIEPCHMPDALLLNDNKFEKPLHFYTCKHHDPKTGDCTIYDIRPAVCRDYPYGRKCNYRACTWTDHKETVERPRDRQKRLRVLKSNTTAGWVMSEDTLKEE